MRSQKQTISAIALFMLMSLFSVGIASGFSYKSANVFDTRNAIVQTSLSNDSYAASSSIKITITLKDTNNILTAYTETLDGSQSTAASDGSIASTAQTIIYTPSDGRVKVNFSKIKDVNNKVVFPDVGDTLLLSVSSGNEFLTTSGTIKLAVLGTVLQDYDSTQTTSYDGTMAVKMQPHNLVINAGNAQTAAVSGTFAAPLKVYAAVGTTPYASLPVKFTAPKGFVFASPDSVSSPYIQTVNTLADGYATASVLTAGTTAGQLTVTATATGYPTVSFTETVTPGPVFAANSAFTKSGSKTAYVAGVDAYSLTIAARDQYGNVVSQLQAAVTVTGGAANKDFYQQPSVTNVDGYATVSVVSTEAGVTKTVTANLGNGVSFSAPISFIAGSVSATTSTITTTAAGNVVGVDSYTFTIALVDAYGNPVIGTTPSVAITGTGNLYAQPAATNNSGKTTVTLQSSGADSKSVTVSAGGATLATQPTFTYQAGAPSKIVVTGPTTPVASSTPSTATITATVQDQYGNVADNYSASVAFTVDGYGTITASNALSNGVTQATFTSDGNGDNATATVTATLGTISGTGSITLIPFSLQPLSVKLIGGDSYAFTLFGGSNAGTVQYTINHGANTLGSLTDIYGVLQNNTNAGVDFYANNLSALSDVYATGTVGGASVSTKASVNVYAQLVLVGAVKSGADPYVSVQGDTYAVISDSYASFAFVGGDGYVQTYTIPQTGDPYVSFPSISGDVTGGVLNLRLVNPYTAPQRITLKIQDATAYNGSQTTNFATVKVDVIHPLSAVSTIYLDTVNNKNKAITVTGGSGSYTYQSSGTAVSVVNGQLTANATGTVTITVKDAVYPKVTTNITVIVEPRLALLDSYGTVLPNAALPGKVGSGKALSSKLTGGSGSYSVSVSGPVTATVTAVGDLYTFSAPTTGAFAGTYTITFTDTVSKLTRAYTVTVPYRVEVSKRTILTTDANQVMNVYGAAKGDTFTVAVLDPATKPLTAFSAAGNATPPATATVATAVAVGVDQYAATVTVVPSKTTVTVATPVLVRITKSGTAPQPTGNAPMVVAPAKTYTIAVTDAATGKALQGATVALNQPADFAGSMTTDNYGKATFNLPDAGYHFEVSSGTGYLPGTVKVGFGNSSGATALTPLTNGVTYTVTVTSPYSGVNIAAFDANNKVIQGVVNGSTATVSFDPANFTMDRVMIAAKGAKPVVIKAAGFTAKAAAASLTGLPQISASDLGNVVQKARTLLKAGSVDPAQLTKPVGVSVIKALLKPQVGDAYTTPGTAAVALSGNRPVLQVMLDAAGAIVSAPVVHPPLSAPADGSTRTEDTGSTEPLTLGGTTATAVSMPSMAVLKNVSIRLPATAFKQSVGQVFTSISAASIDSYSTQKAKADFTGGELVEIDLTVFNVAGTDVYSTDSGNSLISGVPVTLPLDQYALIAQYNVTDAYGVKSVDSAAVIAAFANGTLAIWTASSIADFEAGVGLSQVPAADVTYNPATGEAEFTLTHFSAVGAGAGAGTTAAATAGGGGGCVAPVTSFNQLLVFAGILFMLGLMMRRRRS